jgi:transcriptional regulator with XRE-family HTH domain
VTNERLRSQIAAAGLTVNVLAERIGVNPKTVERWFTKDRLPHRNHRSHSAQALQVDEAYLWPQLLDDPRVQSVSGAELLMLYPHRSNIPADHWAQLIHGTHDRLDVLVYSGLFLLDSQSDLVEQFVAKAENGAKVRLLLGDPDSPAVTRRAREEGLGENLSARIRVSLDLLKPVL